MQLIAKMALGRWPLSVSAVDSYQTNVIPLKVEDRPVMEKSLAQNRFVAVVQTLAAEKERNSNGSRRDIAAWLGSISSGITSCKASRRWAEHPVGMG